MSRIEVEAERFAEQITGGDTIYLLTVAAHGCELSDEHVEHICAFEDRQEARNALQQIVDVLNKEIEKENKKLKKEHDELYANIKKQYAELWKKYPVRCNKHSLFRVTDDDCIKRGDYKEVWIEKMKIKKRLRK